MPEPPAPLQGGPRSIFDFLNDARARYKTAFALLALFLGTLYSLMTVAALPRLLVIAAAVLIGWATYKVLGLVARDLLHRTKPAFPRGHVFRGVYGLPDGDQAVPHTFDRSAELEQYAKAILEGRQRRRRVLVLTGRSGAGKSILASQLAHRLRSATTCPEVRFESFASFNPADIPELLAFVHSNKTRLSSPRPNSAPPEIVIILDQLEICLDHIIAAGPAHHLDGLTSRPRHLATASTAETLTDLLNLTERYARLVIVLVVRSDRYYDLRLLGPRIPPPQDAFEVHGIAEGHGLDSLHSALMKISFEASEATRLIDSLRDPDGTVLPVRAQLLGCMLERDAFIDSHRIRNLFRGGEQRLARARWPLTLSRFQQLGSEESILEHYFRTVLASARDAQVARELLFILAIEGRVRDRYTVTELSSLTYRTEQELQTTLDDFVDAGLIAGAYDGYSFSHDYLAEVYLKVSGRLLPPVVRDNLSYAHTLRDAAGGERSTDSSVDVWQYSLVLVKLLVLVFCVYRLVEFRIFPLDASHTLVGFPFAPWSGLPFAQYSVSSTWFIDWHYLPLALVQYCWGTYVVDLVANIFLRIREGRGMRFASSLMVLSVVVGLLWTAFVPAIWLVWIGLNGLLVGVKFWALGRRLRTVTGGGNRYSLIGLYTIINCSVCVYIGTVTYSYVAWDLPTFAQLPFLDHLLSWMSFAPKSRHLSVYYAVVPLLIYFIYMYRAHARPSRAVEFIGLYGRLRRA